MLKMLSIITLKTRKKKTQQKYNSYRLHNNKEIIFEYIQKNLVEE